MKGSWSSLVGLKGSGASDISLGQPRVSGLVQALSQFDEASDLLVVHRDFEAALEMCERGCHAIRDDPESHRDYRCEDVKTSMCIVGIQALAEMNRWREVLSWLLQYYEVPEKLPVKILEMCILLHSKVEEPLVMLDVGGGWLRHPTNQRLPGYGVAARLYLMQVLLPLGRFEEAEALARDGGAFSEPQQQVLLGAIAEHRQSWDGPGLRGKQELTSEEGPASEKKKPLGPPPEKLKSLLKFLRSFLGWAGSRILCLPIKKLFLAALILWLLVLRLDPAASLSQPFLTRLVWMLRHAWAAIAPAASSPGISH